MESKNVMDLRVVITCINEFYFNPHEYKRVTISFVITATFGQEINTNLKIYQHEKSIRSSFVLPYFNGLFPAAKQPLFLDVYGKRTNSFKRNRTEVRISGTAARVHITQVYQNLGIEAIEVK